MAQEGGDGGGGGHKHPRDGETDPERQVYVGGLPWSANEESLKEDFGVVGEVTHVRVRNGSWAH